MASESSASSASSRWSEAGAIAESNQVDDWLAIQPDGTVTAFSGKVELGQGVRTALAQIVAEELDVPFDRVHMVMGDTGRTPDEGYTAGSVTIEYGGYALRHASAEARRALLELASDRLDATVEELSVRDGMVFVTDRPERAVTYAELAGGKRLDRTITGNAAVKRPQDYHIVGQPVRRVDLPHKITGESSFVHDLRLPGMLHARVVRPPSAGAELVSIQPESVPLVRVVRLGNFVGVVAEREEDVVRAVPQLKASWRETARLPRQEELFDVIRHQPASEEVVVDRGDVESALRSATTHLTASYHQPFQAHASIGPSCAVADVQGDRAVVWSNTQGVYPLRRALADLLEMPPEQVQVIHVEGAGSYGHNGAEDAAADAVILSRAVGKPVRVQWSRQDEFAWEPYAPAMVMEVRGGLDHEGNVIAWAYDVWTPTHVSRPGSGRQLLAGLLIYGWEMPRPMWFGGGTRNAPTNYDFPNQRVRVHWLESLPLRSSAMRSLGAAGNTFANESFMDELAAAAGIDPLEFRLRYLSDSREREVLEAAARHAGWGTSLLAGQGRGLAFARYENDAAIVATVAHVEVDSASGAIRVKRIVVAHDCGLIINPDGLRNQIEGNAIQSLSRALYEQITFDESHVTSVDWDTYPILKFSEVPDVEVVLIDRPEQKAVGSGEPSTITTAAAVANAVFDATGVRLRQVPFRSVPS